MASTPMTTPRVFVDSSVLFAACLSPAGSARDLLLAGLRGDLLLPHSSLVLEETERNLAAKAPAGLPAFRQFRPQLELHLVNPTTAQVRRAAAVVESKDAPIVAGAIRARAKYLATYDRRHLLAHKEAIQRAFRIIVATPEEVLAAEELTAPRRGGPRC